MNQNQLPFYSINNKTVMSEEKERNIRRFANVQLEFMRYMLCPTLSKVIWGTCYKQDGGILVDGKFLIVTRPEELANGTVLSHQKFSVLGTNSNSQDSFIKGKSIILFPVSKLFGLINGINDEVRILSEIKSIIDKIQRDDSQYELSNNIGGFIETRFEINRLEKYSVLAPCFDDYNKHMTKFVNRNGFLTAVINTYYNSHEYVNVPLVAKNFRDTQTPFLAPGKPNTCFLREDEINSGRFGRIYCSSDLIHACILNQYTGGELFTYLVGDIEDVSIDIFNGNQFTYVIFERNGFDINETLSVALKFYFKFKGACRFAIDKYRDASESKRDPLGFHKMFFGISDVYAYYNREMPLDYNDNHAVFKTSILRKTEDIKPRDALIEGLISVGSLVLISGVPKSGKSLLCQQIAKLLSTGGTLWDLNVKKAKTLLFDTELAEADIKDRGLAAARNFNLHIFLEKSLETTLKKRPFIDPNATHEEMIEEYFKCLTVAVKKENFKCVIIDCIYRFIDDTSSRQTKALITWAKHLNEDGVTVILVHHTSKRNSRGKSHEKVSGHSNLIRGVDTSILLAINHFQEDPENKKEIYIDFLLRGFPDREAILTKINKDLEHEIIQSNEPIIFNGSSKNRDMHILKFLRRNLKDTPDQAISTTDLVNLAVACNLGTDSTIKVKLKDWVKLGYISISKEPFDDDNRVRGRQMNRYYKGEIFRNARAGINSPEIDSFEDDSDI